MPLLKKIETENKSNTQITSSDKHCKTVLTISMKRWKKIIKLVKYIKKIKYILSVLYDFAHDLEKHIDNLIANNMLDTFESAELGNMLCKITQEIEYLRCQIKHMSIYFYNVKTNNMSRLVELYITCIGLLEKYGLHDIIVLINYYFIIYTGLQDIYYLYNTYNIYNTYNGIVTHETNIDSDDVASISSIAPTNYSIASSNSISSDSIANTDNKTKLFDMNNWSNIDHSVSLPSSIIMPTQGDKLNSSQSSIENSYLENNDVEDSDIENNLEDSDSENEDDLIFPMDTELVANNTDNNKTNNSSRYTNDRLSPPEIKNSLMDICKIEHRSKNIYDILSIDLKSDDTTSSACPPKQHIGKIGNNMQTCNSQTRTTTTSSFNDSYFQNAMYQFNKIFTKHLFDVYEQKHVNSSSVFPNDILKHIYADASKAEYNYQYLDVVHKVITPINTSVFFNYNTRMYNLLSYFADVGLLKNKLLLQPNTVLDTSIIKIIDNLNNIFSGQQKQNTYQGINSNFIKIIAVDHDNDVITNNIFNFKENHSKLVHIVISISICNNTSARYNTHFHVQFVTTGFINCKSTNILKKYSIPNKHLQNTLQKINAISSIPYGFKRHVGKMLDMRLLLISDNKKDVENYCYNKWNLYKKFRDMSITECMNNFLCLNKGKKAEVLSVLLLTSHSDPDSAFKCYTLWDLIVDEAVHNENNISVENDIAGLIHPELRVKLRRIISVNSEYEKDLLNINENELTYERKIILSKGDSIVKQKAFEKLKEINSKANSDGNSKAQHYLDALLKIPFNTYSKEWIIQKMDTLLYDTKITFVNLLMDIYGLGRTYLTCYTLVNNIIDLIPYKSKNKISAILNKISAKCSTNCTTFGNGTNTETSIFGIHTNPCDYISSHCGCSKYGSMKTIMNEKNTDTENIETELVDAIPSYCLRKHFLKSLLNKIKQINSPASNKYSVNTLLDRTNNFEELRSLLKNIESNNSHNLHNLHIIKSLIGRERSINNCDTNNYYASVESIIDIVAQSPEQHIKIVNDLIDNGYCYDSYYPVEIDTYYNDIKLLIARYTQLRKDQSQFLNECQQRMDDSIYGQQDAKRQILRIIAQWLNGNQEGYCLGFEGSPGLGKTSLAKYGISQALKNNNEEARPFGFIALGGAANGSILEGHSYTYVGSTWGRIVDILIQSKCMNPIIFIDELDKISATDNGNELIGILTHLTDKTQNNEFMDKYFSGIKLDLSKVLFIFSYNDYSLLDSILADRIHRVQFNNYTVYDKLNITSKYLVPRISNEVNILDYKIQIPESVAIYIIDSYTFESGVRKLKEKLYDIFRELNITSIANTIRSEYSNHNNNTILDSDGMDSDGESCEEIVLTCDMVDNILSRYTKIDFVRPLSTPMVGMTYGLYATVSGVGGIMMIQATKRHLDATGGSLICTGKQGDVMQESMKVALTLAGNLVTPEQLNSFVGNNRDNSNLATSSTNSISNSNNGSYDNDNNDNILTENANKIQSAMHHYKYGFHIHCPDGASPKDGPSAGCAITLALVSLITGTSIRNDISMTGEVDVIGNVLPIGGLSSKIQGSKKAGIYTIMVPEKNRKDIEKITEKTPDILDRVNIIFISNINEVINHGLCINNDNGC